MDIKEFDLIIDNVETYDKSGKDYSVSMFLDLPDQPQKFEYGNQMTGSELIKAQFEKALRFEPKAIIVKFFHSLSPKVNAKPAQEFVIKTEKYFDSYSPEANQQHTLRPDERGLSGVVDGETLTIDAMVERIKNLNFRLGETNQLLADERRLRQELEDELADDLAEPESKGWSVEKIAELAGLFAPIFSGGQPAGQLSGQTANDVKASVKELGEGEGESNLSVPLQNVVNYLSSMNEDEFTKAYTIFYHISKSGENLQNLFDEIKKKEGEVHA